jgi:hypothetical protein
MSRLVYMPGVCRECGCTDERACVDPALGACSWVEPDLCSFCAPDVDEDEADEGFEVDLTCEDRP